MMGALDALGIKGSLFFFIFILSFFICIFRLNPFQIIATNNWLWHCFISKFHKWKFMYKNSTK